MRIFAAVVEVAVRTVTLPNLRYCYSCGAQVMLVLFRLMLIALALIEDDKFISVYGNTWKLSCSLTVFHHVLVLLLRYNYSWRTLPFDELLSMRSYDFVTTDKFEKMVHPFWPLVLEFGSFWLFSGLHLAPWQKVDLATLPAITNAIVFASTVLDLPLGCAKLVCFYCKFIFNAWWQVWKEKQ